MPQQSQCIFSPVDSLLQNTSGNIKLTLSWTFHIFRRREKQGICVEGRVNALAVCEVSNLVEVSVTYQCPL